MHQVFFAVWRHTSQTCKSQHSHLEHWIVPWCPMNTCSELEVLGQTGNLLSSFVRFATLQRESIECTVNYGSQASVLRKYIVVRVWPLNNLFAWNDTFQNNLWLLGCCLFFLLLMFFLSLQDPEPWMMFWRWAAHLAKQNKQRPTGCLPDSTMGYVGLGFTYFTR